MQVIYGIFLMFILVELSQSMDGKTANVTVKSNSTRLSKEFIVSSRAKLGRTKALKSEKSFYPIANCADTGKSGLQLIEIPYSDFGPFMVVCENATKNGNWTIIQRRMDGSVNFNRPWSEYKRGFGNLDGEFFIGLDKLNILTTYSNQELYIILEDFNGLRKYAFYSEFEIGNETDDYRMNALGKYTGTAGDALTYHKSRKFSTYDRNNGEVGNNCGKYYKGGWWYGACHQCNLNGVYLEGYYKANRIYGIEWSNFKTKRFYSLKFVQMMIRPTPL